MAAKKKRVSKASPKSSNKSGKKANSFNWLVGIGIIALVAIIGILVVNLSNAATVSQGKHFIYRITDTRGETTYGINVLGRGTYTRVGKFQSGAIKWKNGDYCYTIANVDKDMKKRGQGTLGEVYYQDQEILISKKSSCNL